jgi:hypothetical protein
MPAVEQYARARVITDADSDPRDDRASVRIMLRYDPETDPRSVRLGLPGRHEWTLSRTLLEQGLRAPAESGDVRVWPCGRVQAVVELHSPQGVSVVQFDTKAILRFLRQTYLAAPAAQRVPSH